MRRLAQIVQLGLASAAALVVLPLSPGVAAADERAECGAAYEGAQRSRLAGRDLETRRELLACVRTGCPEFIRADCIAWLAQLDADQPSIVIAALDAGGRDLTGATVDVDGVALPDFASGLPHAVDPGRHVVRMTAQGRSATLEVVVRRGERARRIELRLDAEAARPASDARASSGRVSTPVLVLGGVSLALLVTGGVLWAFGGSRASSYNDACESAGGAGCSTSEHDSVRRELVVGDVAVALGIGAAATAVVLLLTQPKSASASVASAGVYRF